jgi:hypothetical protein
VVTTNEVSSVEGEEMSSLLSEGVMGTIVVGLKYRVMMLGVGGVLEDLSGFLVL